MEKAKIAIIGGGSVGLFCANLLDSNNNEVWIFEKNNKLGKKILASGNGKCNFTNKGNYKDKYNNEFANDIINKFSVEETINEFKKKGLVYKEDKDGRCYPISESSKTVLDVLKKGLSNTKILLETEVKKIAKENNKYQVYFNSKKEIFDYVICCSGSSASNLGSEKAYNYLDNLDLKMEKVSPSLVPLKVYENVKSLMGVRVKCLVSLLNEKQEKVYEEEGEVLFKEEGLSGIAIFNVSNYINRNNGKYQLSLDYTRGFSEEEFIQVCSNSKNIKESFIGIFNEKLGEYLINKYELNKENNYKKIYSILKNDKYTYKELYGLVDAQVCHGGVSIDEVNSNLETKKYSNMYIGGELLNIDGVCGGYNLQFAWSSAGIIAKDILRKIGE